MALIECPKCNFGKNGTDIKNTYDDSASSCPKCGYIPWKTKYRRVCFSTIGVSWAFATTNATIFGAEFLLLLQKVAITVGYIAVLALLAQITWLSLNQLFSSK